MKPQSHPLNSVKASEEKYPKDIFRDFAKVKLKRRQYLDNLIATNKICLKNHNINTLLLF